MSMTKRVKRDLFLFLFVLGVGYGALVAPWGLGDAYAAGYRAVLAGASSLVTDLEVVVRASELNRPRFDSVVVVFLTVSDSERTHRAHLISTRYYPFIASCLLAALVIATPIPLADRLRALFLALLALQAFVVLEMLLHLRLLLPPAPAPGLYGYLSLAKHAAYFAWYLPPLLLWIAFAGRRYVSMQAHPET